ncbi:MAG TPA: pilus assembly protein TadG-related protein [Terriglobia bacterium]|nr:pilus assembly protein TadG-related protein [Terriglobia bacterium]
MRNLYARKNRYDDRGVSILIIAVSMVFVLGIAGLGIDLASLYVGRNQAQRAADAGALAAAQYIALKCTAGSGTLTPDCQAKAKDKAVAVTNANLIAGVTPNITTADVTFIETSANDPQLQVIAGRDTAHTNPMPTFFVKIFGIYSANVSAKAVAEAFNPAGGGPPVGAKCLKPWLMPNCDPGHNWTSGYKNPACADSSFPSGYASQFIDSYPSSPYSTTLLNPGSSSGGGVQGETITIKSSDPSQASGPSKFYPVYLPPGQVASACPSCANGGGGGGPSSGSLYRQNIECCNTTQISCGSQVIQPITGNMVGPTGQGVDCLIHQQGSSGQDTIAVPGSGGDLWTITAGSANPYGQSGPIDTSDSVVTVPLYDGTPLCPGNSCASQITVTVVGYLQLFLNNETSGNVNTTVMNVIPCPSAGGGGNGGPPVVAGGGSSPVPVRLIHQ